MSDSNNSNSGIDYSKYEISTTTWIVSCIFFIICIIRYSYHNKTTSYSI